MTSFPPCAYVAAERALLVESNMVQEEDEMATKKQTVKKRASAKRNAAKGESYACEACGLVVTVDEDCGCVDACEIMCCDMPMKKTRKSGTSAVTC
jgi:hypothetical protein